MDYKTGKCYQNFLFEVSFTPVHPPALILEEAEHHRSNYQGRINMLLVDRICDSNHRSAIPLHRQCNLDWWSVPNVQADAKLRH